MATRIANYLARNQSYAATYHAPPRLADGILKNKAVGKKAAVIISCSDPRVIPEQFLDMNLGEGAVIRNAGGRTMDAMRSILSLDAVGNLGTIVVVHHTDCGMSHTDEAGFLAKTKDRHSDIEKFSGDNAIFGAIDDPYKTVVEDVTYLQGHKSLSQNMEIVGLVFDIKTGLLTKVDV
ncbi:carbonic anhydrase-5 [Coleophoma crateriformis]|uniref:Carbonic anhydrase n=1 Tax=Coleophoma crateriformis TaxID=565419 RepID=A0A3D8S316_9HELO|nr:carbonic anhydrase-5 [Coleophoma crateriformis]